jgi:hypothetical protein
MCTMAMAMVVMWLMAMGMAVSVTVDDVGTCIGARRIRSYSGNSQLVDSLVLDTHHVRAASTSCLYTLLRCRLTH